jgi:hypothetical protein
MKIFIFTIVMNKKISSVLIFVLFLAQTGIAQSNSESSVGYDFVKRIEYNVRGPGYNLKGKTELEKLFFGDFNAELEFFINPSFEGAYGFRLVGDSLKTSYFLEVKYINNFNEVTALLAKKYPTKGFSAKEMSSISKEEIDYASQHNNAMFKKQQEESFLRYKIETMDYSITNDFAEKLYSVVVATIQNFKGKGAPLSICLDGFSVTFRCTVEDELWTLTVHLPTDKTLRLTDICKQLFADVQSKNVDESHYIALFEEMTSTIIAQVNTINK